MMENAWVGLVGVIAGALLGGAANLLVEDYKRRADRNGIASAIAGEIYAVTSIADRRGFVKYLEALVPKLRSDSPPPPPWVTIDTSIELTPIVRAYTDELGSLGGKLPQRVARFYTTYWSIRAELTIIARETEPLKAADRIERNLSIWYETKKEGEALVADLLALSGETP